MSYLSAFAYTKGDTILHRLDPRSKGFMVISAAISLGLLISGIVFYLILIGILLLAVYASGLGRQVYTTLRSYAILSAALFALNLWATHSLIVSSIIIERLVLFVELFSLISLTTSPEDLGSALLKLGFPYTLALAFTMSLRFIPTVAVELKSIEDSQRARGLELDKGGFVTRLKNYIPILIPLLVNAILRAEQVAEAMESKCFGAATRPTRIKELRFGAADWVTLMLSLAMLTGLSYHYVFTHSPLTLF
ncbi:MAG: energy-coupling factor transporter transmembrane component T [Thermoprotei archaeon]